MLVIRQAQFDVFIEQAGRNFENGMADYLQSEYPALTEPMGRAAVLDLVKRARRAAARCQVHNAGAVGAWIELWLLFGDDLKRSPDRAWAQRFLRNHVLPDYIRLEQVRERLLSRTGGRAVILSTSPQA
ncbi:MAG: hypothetical protein KAY46_10585 [Burkholderiaceae bacterium]|nr:hypothetical protein [Burkholderiaceae bacterium]